MDFIRQEEQNQDDYGQEEEQDSPEHMDFGQDDEVEEEIDLQRPGPYENVTTNLAMKYSDASLIAPEDNVKTPKE